MSWSIRRMLGGTPVTTTVVGVFLSLLAVAFYLALAIFHVIDPIRLMRHRSRRQAPDRP